MKNLNRYIWGLSQESEGEFLIYPDILKEFKAVEAELKTAIEEKTGVDKNLLKYRDQLNKLLANTPPFMVEEYNLVARQGSTTGGHLQ